MVITLLNTINRGSNRTSALDSSRMDRIIYYVNGICVYNWCSSIIATPAPAKLKKNVQIAMLLTAVFVCLRCVPPPGGRRTESINRYYLSSAEPYSTLVYIIYTIKRCKGWAV